MRIEVLYISRGGTTRMLAEAIAEEAKTKAKDLKTNPRISSFDIAFIGSGNYGVEPDNEIVGITHKVKIKNKRIAIFGTFGGQFNAVTEMEGIFRKAGANIIGKWGCKGKFMFFSRKGPTKKDLDAARKFAKSILKTAN